ncbi:MAG TPA: hypothetical protein VM639_19090 [Dongiaceae bacterium]|nr:hypothetical protein [Dongiaceae bacterium]
MAAGRLFGMTRRDRRCVAFAAGLLALWLQLLAPFVLVSGMQAAMSQPAAAADAIDYLCQPIDLGHGKSDHGKHLLRLDCQLCQSLHLLAQGLAPTAALLAMPDLPAAQSAQIIAITATSDHTDSGFSSRAPPVL